MMMIPVQLTNNRCVVFAILQDDNFDRIKHYDPAVLAIDKLPEDFRKLPLHEIHICYATQAEANAIEDAARRNNQKDMMRLVQSLGRNFRFRPEKGDHDGDPETIRGDGDSLNE